MQFENKQTNMLWFVGIVLTVLALSQIIGYWVNSTIPQNTSVEWSRLIHFTHIRNHGGVFGMLQGMGGVFAVISIALLIGVSTYLWVSPSIKRYEYICFGFIVGGGASNILDRLVYGSVIDFIDIQHIPYWNYIFNTADVMVHVGIWPLLFLSFLVSTDETNSSKLN
ncbi:MAG: signal peptidase II [Gammaproteobacteria bacterium]|jgi:signal peptidase II|nr:signal peptidase II [Gammaproteobacteria bacterium]